VEARRGGKAFGEHPRAAEGDVAASGSEASGEGLRGDAVRDAGRPVSELNSAHQFDSGRSGATAPVQDLAQCGDTTVTVPAWHSASLLTSYFSTYRYSVAFAVSARSFTCRTSEHTPEFLSQKADILTRHEGRQFTLRVTQQQVTPVSYDRYPHDLRARHTRGDAVFYVG
jgi:hypothetical protein